MQTQNRHAGRACAALESLEPRRHLSVATKTTAYYSATSLLLGQTETITVKVKPASGSTIPQGKIQILDYGAATELSGHLNKKGEAILSFPAGYALYFGPYEFSATFHPTNAVAASHSATTKVSVSSQLKHLHTRSDGVQYQTITAGTGAAVAKGNTITVQATGWEVLNSKPTLISETLTHSPDSAAWTVEAHPAQVPVGLDAGVLGMQVGETRDIIIPSIDLYDDGNIGLYVVKLLSIT